MLTFYSIEKLIKFAKTILFLIKKRLLNEKLLKTSRETTITFTIRFIFSLNFSIFLCLI